MNCGIQYKFWTYRHSCLHHTSTADEIRGLDELGDVLLEEHRRGLRTLDRRKYGKFFRRHIDTLLKDITQKRRHGFFSYAQQGTRIIQDIVSSHTLDSGLELSSDDLLREWVGLTPIGVVG